MENKSQQQQNLHFSPEYGDKVYLFLNRLAKIGETYTIDRICAKENQPTFIAYIKEYMDLMPQQGGWQFSDDYKKLKKFELIDFEHRYEIDRGIYTK